MWNARLDQSGRRADPDAARGAGQPRLDQQPFTTVQAVLIARVDRGRGASGTADAWRRARRGDALMRRARCLIGLSIPGDALVHHRSLPDQPPDVPCDPTGNGWRGPQGFPGPPGPQGVPGASGIPGDSVVNVLDHGAKGDGVTDDTAAIQNALNAYAGKATVFVPDTGQAYVTGGLVVPTGTDLLLSGTLQARTNGGTVLNILNGARNVTVRGHGTIDCNGANQTGPQAGVYLYQASYVQVSGITVKNSINWSVNVGQSSHVRFDGVSLIGGVNSNEFVGGGIGATDCWIVNSYISGPSNDSGFTFYSGITDSGMSNCTVTGAFVSAVGVYADNAQPNPCARISINR